MPVPPTPATARRLRGRRADGVQLPAQRVPPGHRHLQRLHGRLHLCPEGRGDRLQCGQQCLHHRHLQQRWRLRGERTDGVQLAAQPVPPGHRHLQRLHGRLHLRPQGRGDRLQCGQQRLHHRCLQQRWRLRGQRTDGVQLPPSQCHQATGTCNTSTGACTYALKAAGTACNADNNACTTDICNTAGACVASAPKVCNSPPGNCQKSTGTCNPTNGVCSYRPSPRAPSAARPTAPTRPATAAAPAWRRICPTESECGLNCGTCNSGTCSGGCGSGQRCCPGDGCFPTTSVLSLGTPGGDRRSARLPGDRGAPARGGPARRRCSG